VASLITLMILSDMQVNGWKRCYRQAYEIEVRSRRSMGQYRWQLDRECRSEMEDGNIVKWYGHDPTSKIANAPRKPSEGSEAYFGEAQRLRQTGSGMESSRISGTGSGECYRF